MYFPRKQGKATMQIKTFIGLGQSGQIKEVTAAKREGGYSLIAETDVATEVLRTQLGEPKLFKNFDVLMSKLKEANINKVLVLNC